MVWGDIMTSFGPMCVVTSAIARFIPIFKLEYFWNAKTYTGEILIWCHIDGVLSEKPQNTHNLNCLFFNGCLGWKFKNCWNDWYKCPSNADAWISDVSVFCPTLTRLVRWSIRGYYVSVLQKRTGYRRIPCQEWVSPRGVSTKSVDSIVFNKVFKSLVRS